LFANDPSPSFDCPKHQWPGSAMNGHWLWPRAMSACGSQSGRSDNAPQTAGFDPKPSWKRIAFYVYQRLLTPSCGGPNPYRVENSGPDRNVTRSLTPIPELKNSRQGIATSGSRSPQGLFESR
jgi:hypothetical protein